MFITLLVIYKETCQQVVTAFLCRGNLWKHIKFLYLRQNMLRLKTTRRIYVSTLSLCQHLIFSHSFTKGPVKVFSEVILKVRSLRLMLYPIVQELERIWGFKSKDIYTRTIVSQTSFGHISINSSSILTGSMATESP